MKQYKDLIIKIINEGEFSEDRTGTGTQRIFSYCMTFNCSTFFPLVTLKYTHFPAIAHELLWFISGDSNIKYLQDNNVTIWNEWANEEGDLGPVYGVQWRNAHGRFRKKVLDEYVSDGIDQLQNCIDLIKNNPSSRRMIVNCWLPKVLPEESIPPKENPYMGKMALAPCHLLYQFFVEKGLLHIQMYQRSVDAFLGLPFNIASYALLLYLVASVTNLKPGNLHWIGGDIHLYNNHKDQVQEMLQRPYKPLSRVTIYSRDNIDDFTIDDIELCNYMYHPAIKADISV